MTIQELAEQENLLCSKVIELYDQPQTPEADNRLRQVFAEYRKVHQAYANFSDSDSEALKRGLFIQWYAMTEPSYLTGIADLNENAEEKIMQVLSDTINTESKDEELIWMISYYSHWEWFFERYPAFTNFKPINVNLPDLIDREVMAQRGQMGSYWNSLNGSRQSE